jgi:hypothetical protein
VLGRRLPPLLLLLLLLRPGLLLVHLEDRLARRGGVGLPCWVFEKGGLGCMWEVVGEGSGQEREIVSPATETGVLVDRLELGMLYGCWWGTGTREAGIELDGA